MPNASPEKPAAAAKRKPAAKPPQVAPVPATVATTETVTPGTLRLKTLIERVAASTGGKKKGLKEIVEATLAQLGLALQNGEMLNLPELGKVRVAKAAGANPGSAMTLKLRLASKTGKNAAKEVVLAEVGEPG